MTSTSRGQIKKNIFKFQKPKNVIKTIENIFKTSRQYIFSSIFIILLLYFQEGGSLCLLKNIVVS